MKKIQIIFIHSVLFIYLFDILKLFITIEIRNERQINKKLKFEKNMKRYYHLEIYDDFKIEPNINVQIVNLWNKQQALPYYSL